MSSTYEDSCICLEVRIITGKGRKNCSLPLRYLQICPASKPTNGTVVVLKYCCCVVGPENTLVNVNRSVGSGLRTLCKER